MPDFDFDERQPDEPQIEVSGIRFSIYDLCVEPTPHCVRILLGPGQARTGWGVQTALRRKRRTRILGVLQLPSQLLGQAGGMTAFSATGESQSGPPAD